MKLYIFAGPNGSGKSTIIKSFIEEYSLGDIEYVCPDIYAASVFSDIADIKERYLAAMKFAEYKRDKLVKNGKSLILETVLSRKDKLDFIKKAKEKGYFVVAVFVGTETPEINIERVKVRAENGGHDVPEEKIRERYVRSMDNLKALSKLSDEFYVFDNSDTPRLVSSVVDNIRYEAKDIPTWASLT